MMKCTACGRPYQPSRAIAPHAAPGFGPQRFTPTTCECGNDSFTGFVSMGYGYAHEDSEDAAGVLLRAGTLIHVEGMPFRLLKDTRVDGNENNLGLTPNTN
jgi:hypothetical protein